MPTQTERKRPDTDANTNRRRTTTDVHGDRRRTNPDAHGDRERTTTDAHVDEAARHARELNDRILESSKQAANATLNAYERALETMTGFTERVAGASRIEWISAAAQAQAGLTRDLGRAYVSSARTLLK